MKKPDNSPPPPEGQRSIEHTIDLNDNDAIRKAIQTASPRVFKRWRAKGYTFDEADPATWPQRFIRRNGRVYTPKPYDQQARYCRSNAYRYLCYARAHLRRAWREANQDGMCSEAVAVLETVAREAVQLEAAIREVGT